MLIEGHRRKWHVADEATLREALSYRDNLGGAIFWLSPDKVHFPVLTLRISGKVADVYNLQVEDHPGYRYLAINDLPAKGTTCLIFEGADPASGEETENEFVVPVEQAIAIAKEFFHTQQIPKTGTWFEL